MLIIHHKHMNILLLILAFYYIWTQKKKVPILYYTGLEPYNRELLKVYNILITYKLYLILYYAFKISR